MIDRLVTGRALCCLILSCIALSVRAAPARHELDIPYARVDGRALALDLHLPSEVSPPPLVIYLHGGAWRAGDKKQYPEFLLQNGYAVASVEFRSTHDAPFPANVHDIKAAIRFLRATARERGYDASRIAVSGVSSGAHLAAVVATTAGVRQLEGNVGDHPQESSAVQALVSWYGASNLTTILAQSTPFGLSVREPSLKLLLGGLPDQVPAMSKLASPVMHVDASDPPAILLHGNQDPQMPVNQTLELQAAYDRAGVAAELLVVDGAGHGGEAFHTGEPASRIIAFLRRTLGR